MKTSIKIKRKLINGFIGLIPYILFGLALYFGVKLGLGPQEGLCWIEGEWTRCFQLIKP